VGGSRFVGRYMIPMEDCGCTAAAAAADSVGIHSKAPLVWVATNCRDPDIFTNPL
jgi:hypothetical protein